MFRATYSGMHKTVNASDPQYPNFKYWFMGILYMCDKCKWFWFAALLDGEGHIGAYVSKHPRGNSIYISMQISNSNLELVERVQDLFGGNVRSDKYRPMHHWHTRRQEFILEILQEIENALIVKRRHAELALKYLKSRKQRRQKHGRPRYNSFEINTAQALQELNPTVVKRVWIKEYFTATS